MGRRRLIVAAALLVCAGAAFAFRGDLRRRLLGPPLAPQTLIGQAAPELPSLPTLDGQPLRLEDRRGQVVLLHFWSYGCTLVDELLPRYDEWQRRCGSRGLTVAPVYTPQHAGETRVVQFERARIGRPSWPMALDAGLASWPTFRVRDSPTVFLIDRDGRVRSVRSGAGIADAVEQDIRSLLQP